MPSCFVSVRKVGMHKCHERSLSLFLKGRGYFRFFSRSVRRHPGMLHSTRPFELRESAVTLFRSYVIPLRWNDSSHAAPWIRVIARPPRDKMYVGVNDSLTA